MEKLDKTKVKVLEHASNEDASKTAASTEVIFSLLVSTSTLFTRSLVALDLVSDFQQLLTYLV